MASSLLTPILEEKLNSIVRELNVSSLLINNMYNGKYIYTLNRFKDILIKATEHLNIDVSIIDTYLLNLIKTEYLPEIEKQCEKIANIPIIEQKTPEWFKQRETMISASDAGYFLKKLGPARAMSSLKIKLGLKSYCNSSAAPLTHGNTYEDVTRAIYESRNCVSVTEYGIISSPTPWVGASPDGIITKSHINTYECQSKYGRLLEIKNPYSREITDEIKCEYMVQILQQQYTTGIPICDFVETTIIDANCNTSNSNNKAYTSLDNMLEDTLDKTRPNWTKRIKNKNIPVDNLNKFGSEKGLLVSYKKIINENDIRNKYIVYPLTMPYEKQTIEKWIVDTNSELFTEGYIFVSTKYWKLDVYSEKTVLYDQALYETQYIPQLCKVWDDILKCNEIKLNGGDLEAYVDNLENEPESAFYNENKRHKKVKETQDKPKSKSMTSFKPNKNIELDF